MVMVSAIRPHYLYDNADIVSDSIRNTINQYCELVDTATTAEIVVVTLKDLPTGKTIEETKLYYFNDVPLDGVKGIGKAGKNNGVLIMIVMETHDWAIEVGYGCEGQLTDAECGRIGRDVMTPQFKDGKFSEGLYYGVKEVAKELGYVVATTTSGTTLNPNPPPTKVEIPYLVWVLVGIIIIVGLIMFIIAVDEGGYSGSGSSGRSSSSGSDSDGGGSFGGGGSGGGGASGPWSTLPIKHQVANFPSGLASFFATNEMLIHTQPDGNFNCPICNRKTPYEKKDSQSQEELLDKGLFTKTTENRLCLDCGCVTIVVVSLTLLMTMAQYQIKLAQQREREEQERREREKQEEEERQRKRKREQEEEEARARRRRNESSHSHSSGSFGGGRSGGGGSVGKW